MNPHLTASPLVVYQHDSLSAFRFRLQGELAGSAVEDLDHAWRTAASITRYKQLIVDVSKLERADERGLELLQRMRAEGVCILRAGPHSAGDAGGWRAWWRRLLGGRRLR